MRNALKIDVLRRSFKKSVTIFFYSILSNKVCAVRSRYSKVLTVEGSSGMGESSDMMLE